MLRRAFEPCNWPVPIRDFRKKANLHQLSTGKIFRIDSPWMGHVCVDVLR